LKVAEQRHCGNRSMTHFVVGQMESLPFPNGTFDLIWCADSFVSLRHPELTLRRLRRLVRLGGWVAIMESDSLHEVLLPWRAELELAVRRAEFEAYQANSHRPENRYVGRQLRELMTNAGFAQVQQQTQAIERATPLSNAEAEYLQRYLRRLEQLVRPYLDERYRRELKELADPKSAHLLANRPGAGITWVNVICLGQKTNSENGE
jgi:hypothetical protein